MVKDSLNSTPVQTSPVPEQAQSSHNVETESKEHPEKPDPLLKKLRCEEDLKSWRLAVPEVDSESLPTHLHPFTSQEEYDLVKQTYHQLIHSGYYWGPMPMEEAHNLLKDLSSGMFLIRDSGQPDVFFTLSYQSVDGPTSVRIQLNKLLFNLYGSVRTFASLFSLLAYYTSSHCKLTEPYRKQRPERLKQMCRRALVHTYGAENLSTLSGLTGEVKKYVFAYPCSI